MCQTNENQQFADSHWSQIGKDGPNLIRDSPKTSAFLLRRKNPEPLFSA